MRVMGIDPGIKGAFAVIELLKDGGLRLVTAQDFPILKEIKNKTKGTTRNRLDLSVLGNQLEVWSSGVKICLIEDVGKMATASDPLSAFAFGYATGAVNSLISFFGIKVEKMKPEIWKSYFALSSDKKKSIELALKLVPESKEFLTLLKHDGRAEAILLAYYAAKNVRIRK